MVKLESTVSDIKQNGGKKAILCLTYFTHSFLIYISAITKKAALTSIHWVSVDFLGH